MNLTMNIWLARRECNAGYVRSDAQCVACAANTFRDGVVAKNVVNEGQVNTCGTCTACVADVSYESTSCTSVRNRVCTACLRTCPAGRYKSSPCSVTQNTQCTLCATTCNAGYYKTAAAVCDGSKTFDAFLAGCAACKQPGDCASGYYISKACLGADTSSNQCLLCSAVPPTGDCTAAQYRGGCYGYTNTICVAFTLCGAGKYLAGESRVQDGVCTPCTNCTGLGLAVLRACSTYDDTMCKGGSCNRSVACVTPEALLSRGRLACDYSSGVESTAYCGMCPRGYGSDGQFCQDCPTGRTCTRLGAVECKGQCQPGVIGTCDGGLMGGYVDCTATATSGLTCTSTGAAAGVGGRYVTRGPYVRAESADCDAYFHCGAGYYRVFRSTGVVECDACPTDLMPHKGVLDRWVTGGLSVGDRRSCLWECKQGLALFNGTRTGCTLLAGRSNGIGSNLPGWWAALQNGSGTKAQCPYGRTSEGLMAVSVGDCTACPPLPAGAVLVYGSSTCDWRCDAYGTVARGGACVSPVEVCAGVRGYVRRSLTSVAAGCTGTSFPWNRGGYAKSGWATPRIEVGGGGAIVAGSGSLQDGITASSLQYGVSGRHTVTVAGVGARSVEGPLCSATRVKVGSYDFLVGAVCNESFLVYLNLSSASKALGVLIGVPGTRGFRNGFRREALFESELYVASGRPIGNVNGSWTPSIFVLDRWNCLVREVVIYGEPGGYYTRAYTVGGDDTNLANGFGLKKCSGASALSWPRKFWALGNDWLAFADETGLWQLHVVRRELLRIVQESIGGFEADSLMDVDLHDGDEFTVRLVFYDGSVWYITAQQDKCPSDFTSMDGGDCVVECDWASSGGVPTRFVNQSTGACTACSTLQCGYGEVFQLCTRESDSVCAACASLGAESGWVYAARGTCDPSSWKRALPCEPGYYAEPGGRFCELCPAFTATHRIGATNILQCKCVTGLVWRGGRCVGTEMFEFEGAVAGQPLACTAKDPAQGGGCVAPRNGNITSTERDVACKWECNAGFYRDTGAGWEDQCRPCLGPLTGAVWTSRGDDDVRGSCEWVSA